MVIIIVGYAYQALYATIADMVEAEYRIREAGRRARRVSDLYPPPTPEHDWNFILYVERPRDEDEPPAAVRRWLERAAKWQAINIGHPWMWDGVDENLRKLREADAARDDDGGGE